MVLKNDDEREPIEIIPDRFYTGDMLFWLIGAPCDSLANARKSGWLRAAKIGPRRYLYRGSWLLDWLDKASDPIATTAIAEDRAD